MSTVPNSELCMNMVPPNFQIEMIFHFILVKELRYIDFFSVKRSHAFIESMIETEVYNATHMGIV